MISVIFYIEIQGSKMYSQRKQTSKKHTLWRQSKQNQVKLVTCQTHCSGLPTILPLSRKDLFNDSMLVDHPCLFVDWGLIRETCLDQYVLQYFLLVFTYFSDLKIEFNGFYLSHTLYFFFHLSTASPASLVWEQRGRKWGNELQSGGGGCVGTSVCARRRHEPLNIRAGSF